VWLSLSYNTMYFAILNPFSFMIWFYYWLVITAWFNLYSKLVFTPDQSQKSFTLSSLESNYFPGNYLSWTADKAHIYFTVSFISIVVSHQIKGISIQIFHYVFLVPSYQVIILLNNLSNRNTMVKKLSNL